MTRAAQEKGEGRTGRRNARRREEPSRVVRLAVVQAPPSPAYRRPQTRGDCEDMPRPCPFVACRYHLAFDVLGGGGVRENFPDLVSMEDDSPLDLEKMPATCALDEADRNGLEDTAVGVRMNLSRERVRQLELKILGYKWIRKLLLPHDL